MCTNCAVVQALCLACGSDPKKGTEKKLGAYVMKTCFQTTTISSAMFITAMAANPLAVSHAKSLLRLNRLLAATMDCPAPSHFLPPCYCPYAFRGRR